MVLIWKSLERQIVVMLVWVLSFDLLKNGQTSPLKKNVYTSRRGDYIRKNCIELIKCQTAANPGTSREKPSLSLFLSDSQ